MTCTTCGRENPPHLTFCQECGQRLGPRIAPPTPPIGLSGGESAPQPNPIAPPQTASEKRCRVCDTLNAAGLRYCTSCGSTLEQGPSPIAATISDANPAPRLDLPIQAPSPIAPMRVVELTPAPAPGQQRTCGRCRGAVEAGAMFCKFCGASLAEAVPAPLLPHERLELPRTSENGGGGRAGTAPMPQVGASQRSEAIAPRVSFPNPVPSPSPIAASLQPPIPLSQQSQPIVIPVVPPSPPAPLVVARIPSSPPPIPPTASRPPDAAPAAKAHGRLVVIAKSGADGPSYPIGDTLDIGRIEGHIIVAEDPYLSPRHVRISWVPPRDGASGKLVLRDIGSTNGVYLRLAPPRDMNARARTDAASPSEVAVPLLDQDLILVGQQVLRFEVVKEAESGLGPAVEHGTLLFGSPASPRYARLSQRTVEGVTRDVYHVRKMETVLGRESGDVVFTEDPFLSRRHAAVRVLGQGADTRYALVDLGSSNGTFLRIRGETDLFPQDHFRVGQQLFRVDLE